MGLSAVIAFVIASAGLICLGLGIFFVTGDNTFDSSAYYLSPTFCRSSDPTIYFISNATETCPLNATSSSQTILLTEDFLPDGGEYFPEIVATASGLSGTLYFVLSDSAEKIILDSSLNSQGGVGSEDIEFDGLDIYHPGALAAQFDTSCQSTSGCEYVPSSDMVVFKDEDSGFNPSDFTLPFTIQFTSETEINGAAESVPDIFIRFISDSYLSALQIIGIVLICISPFLLIAGYLINPEAFKQAMETFSD